MVKFSTPLHCRLCFHISQLVSQGDSSPEKLQPHMYRVGIKTSRSAATHARQSHTKHINSKSKKAFKKLLRYPRLYQQKCKTPVLGCSCLLTLHCACQ